VLLNFRGKSDTILQKSGIINGGKGLFSRAVLYIEKLVREAMEEVKEGIKVGGRLTKALGFADDQAMLAGSQNGLQKDDGSAK